MAQAPTTTPEPKKRLYELKRPCWDGRVRHDAGTQLYFVEDTQPSTAVLVEEDKASTPAPKATV